LVDHFGDEPCTGRTHRREPCSNIRHQRLDAFKIVITAARHDSQRATACCRWPTRDGRINPTTPCCVHKPLRSITRDIDLDGRKINQHLIGREGSRNAFRAKDCVKNRLCRRQVEKNEIRPRYDITRMGNNRNAMFCCHFALVSNRIKACHLIAFRHEMTRHGATH